MIMILQLYNNAGRDYKMLVGANESQMVTTVLLNYNFTFTVDCKKS